MFLNIPRTWEPRIENSISTYRSEYSIGDIAIQDKEQLI